MGHSQISIYYLERHQVFARLSRSKIVNIMYWRLLRSLLTTLAKVGDLSGNQLSINSSVQLIQK